jgi:hypothetical protein
MFLIHATPIRLCIEIYDASLIIPFDFFILLAQGGYSPIICRDQSASRKSDLKMLQFRIEKFDAIPY